MRSKVSVWIMNARGGVGKTTLSVAMMDIMEQAGRKPCAIEVNGLKGLSSFMGRENVLSLESAPQLAEICEDGNAILRHFDPIMVEIDKGDSLLDMGTNVEARFLEYCKLSRIDEDLGGMGVRVIVLIPTVAERDSIESALASIERVRSIVPSAKLVLVLNERDGVDFDTYFGAAMLFELLAAGVFVMVMPKIVSEGWGDFQRTGSRFMDIISMEPTRLMEVHGYSRLPAKRARNDIAAWLKKMTEAATFVSHVGELGGH